MSTVNHGQVIWDNFTALCDSTVCTEDFLIKCKEGEVIAEEEMKLIEKQPEGNTRNWEFYNVLQRKDKDTLIRLLQLMEGDCHTLQSDDVLNILRICLD